MMGVYSRETVEADYQQDGVGETHKTEVGGMVIALESWAKGLDTREMFKDLPDGACQEQHWGYCTKGRVRIRYTGGRPDEVISAGDAYYMAPGHIPVVEDELELVEFTPADQSPDQTPPPGA